MARQVKDVYIADLLQEDYLGEFESLESEYILSKSSESEYVSPSLVSEAERRCTSPASNSEISDALLLRATVK
jgi:hypothetical protein